MCGISLIISGAVRIDLSCLIPDFESQLPQHSDKVQNPSFSVDLKAALQRRGPDSIRSKKLFFFLETYPEDGENLHLFGSGMMIKRLMTSFCSFGIRDDCVISENEVTTSSSSLANPIVEMDFLGATLQLRGTTPVSQPLVDNSRNILIYNGEIFGGLHVDCLGNDTLTLMQALDECCSCSCLGDKSACFCHDNGKTSVPELLSTISGPWALIYWQDVSSTLWFGRDAFGRRSLLVHWPSSDDSRFLLSSVSPESHTNEITDSHVEYCASNNEFWEELSCGIYSIQLVASELHGCLVGKVRKHEWNPGLKKLIEWKRTSVEPKDEKACSGIEQHSLSVPAQKVLIALRDSVMRRAAVNPIMQSNEVGGEKFAPVAILFSGGLDSMILAALLDRCLDSCYEIDLLNVSFDGQFAPDRIAAKAGVKELQRIAPSRRWNLVEIDADLLKLTSEIKHVMSLITPSNTYMDLNIGLALWLAAGGDGWLLEESLNTFSVEKQHLKYKSEAKILLVGTGADEQCAGYGRHRTKYKQGGWLLLHEEMRLDMQRIWKRNLGRDDRCISDNGKEARFPFLDEDVIRILLEIPLWEVADLDQPSGIGDKKILREVARLLQLEDVASLPKRAIQFGSRIARESNKKNFGSNRAANQVSAGSVVIQSRTNGS
ncbi:hypothetical protein Scep_022109 [Stephania cephalantha]|uniref:Asparagine synthetase domain-containing protein n=1 Tax=Stephania cephalantha TaxID=152367 RepID=A0AAP0F4Q9_9MAGN